MKEIVAWTSSNTAWTNRLRQVLTKSKNENCAFYFLLCFIFLMPKMLGIPIHKRLELAFHSHLGPQGVWLSTYNVWFAWLSNTFCKWHSQYFVYAHLAHLNSWKAQTTFLFLHIPLFRRCVSELAWDILTLRVLGIFYLCMHAKSFQSCPTLCNLMDCGLPGSSIHGILQARTLEWIVMPSYRGSSWSRDRTCVSYISYIAGRFFAISATWEAHILFVVPVKTWSTTLDPQQALVFVSGMWLVDCGLLVCWSCSDEHWRTVCTHHFPISCSMTSSW